MGSTAIRFWMAILCRSYLPTTLGEKRQKSVPTGPLNWNKERLKDNWPFYINLRFVKVQKAFHVRLSLFVQLWLIARDANDFEL